MKVVILGAGSTIGTFGRSLGVDGFVQRLDEVRPDWRDKYKVLASAVADCRLNRLDLLWTQVDYAGKLKRSLCTKSDCRRLDDCDETPICEFTTDHADAILAQQDLPDGSLRHVAQVVSCVLKLATYPLKAIDRSPLPQGWLPPRNDAKEKSYLFPVEEAAFHGNRRVPLVRRLLVGLCAREGLRKENAVTLKWCDLTFQSNGEVMISLDTTKNGRGGAWVLDPATAEALRRWNTICPSKTFVFPASALPRHQDTDDWPMYVDHLADQLRDGLKQAKVKREKLFERGPNRIPLRAHDLQATFVTLALANGRTEDWVSTRTRVARGRLSGGAGGARQAKVWLKPLHEIIPELAGLGAQKRGRGRR